MHHNSANKKDQLNTDSLDDAMREFTNICQLYNKKLSVKSSELNDKKVTARQGQVDLDRHLDNKNPVSNKTMNRLTKITTCDENSISRKNTDNIDSIEQLQEKQSELQKQMDEAKQIAQELKSKRRRKLTSILEDAPEQIEHETKIDDDDEEDEELIEFQEIENELRVSELNRQMLNIQEEMRVRLYKNLLINTTNSTASSRCKQINDDEGITRRNSNGDETSSSSSSCSEGPRTDSSSPSNNEINSANQFESVTTELAKTNLGARDANGVFKLPKDAPSFRIFGARRQNQPMEPNQDKSEVDSSLSHSEPIETTVNQDESKASKPSINSELDSIVENIMSEFEALSPSTSKESVNSNQAKTSSSSSFDSQRPNPTIPSTVNRSLVNEQLIPTNIYSIPNTTGPFRNNSANSDLERIEEDEEDEQDFYANSDHFRAIYDEKLHPILQANARCRNLPQTDLTSPKCQSHISQQPLIDQGSIINNNNNLHESTLTDNTFTEEESTIVSVDPNVTKRSAARSAVKNRPLTLYLPKPDEELDLVEHIQTLGHDINIISSDLKLDSKSAHGYLWKSCSNNRKKWLKRYFHFDRDSKILSYFNNEAQLVKKGNPSPKTSIPFDEISDVYVDHKQIGGVDDKDRNSPGKGKNYVFVLATIKRKFTLATYRAETMRVWIDILFTAAKSNDYFQHLDDIELGDSFIIQEESNDKSRKH